MRILLASAAILALGASGLAASPAAPPGASSCSGCHAARKGVDTVVPRLEGRTAAEILSQMQAFRGGQRQSTIMDRIAKGFTDAEMQAIAAWFASQRQ